MGRAACCNKDAIKKGAWTHEEDRILIQYIQNHGVGSWRSLPKNAGLLRCGKSCRLRWTNYLRPDIKRGPFTPQEEATIIQLQGMLGNKWAYIASQLPGRTDNEIKNFYNTHLKKRSSSGTPKLQIHQSCSSSEPINIKCESSSTRHMVQWESARVEAEARMSMESLLFKPTSTVKSHPDIFLQLWNSEVGEAFRNIKGRQGEAAASSISNTTMPSIKIEPDSTDDTVPAMLIKTSTSIDTVLEQEDAYKPSLDVMAVSDSIGSNEFADSSDTALKLLLDFPGGNDLQFIQEESENFSNLLDFTQD